MPALISFFHFICFSVEKQEKSAAAIRAPKRQKDTTPCRSSAGRGSRLFGFHSVGFTSLPGYCRDAGELETNLLPSAERPLASGRISPDRLNRPFLTSGEMGTGRFPDHRVSAGEGLCREVPRIKFCIGLAPFSGYKIQHF
jgi:hypothetical protein